MATSGLKIAEYGYIKGAWQEWDISEIEMAIPMSPD